MWMFGYLFIYFWEYLYINMSSQRVLFRIHASVTSLVFWMLFQIWPKGWLGGIWRWSWWRWWWRSQIWWGQRETAPRQKINQISSCRVMKPLSVFIDWINVSEWLWQEMLTIVGFVNSLWVFVVCSFLSVYAVCVSVRLWQVMFMIMGLLWQYCVRVFQFVCCHFAQNICFVLYIHA